VIRATGYPAPGTKWVAEADRPAGVVPAAESLIPPTRDYFDAQRHSFGLHVGDDGGPFANSYHVGDDVAGRRQHETVVAIGNGIVREVRVAAPSWGGIVIIEHRDPKTKQRYCSLYSHLGPLICVQASQRVGKGEMLGSLGQDYTLATGGYASHLHFGIHLTPYDDPQVPASRNWITGYLSPERFKEGKHAWIDPQPFIRERLKYPSTEE
jgi:murein DD-endopeptidase MepM/ murein hydrolase activator NlpD